MYHLFKMRRIFSVALHAIWTPLALCTGMLSFHCRILTGILSFRRTCRFCISFHILMCLSRFTVTVTVIAARDMVNRESCAATQRHGLPSLNCVSLNKILTLNVLCFHCRLTMEPFFYVSFNYVKASTKSIFACIPALNDKITTYNITKEQYTCTSNWIKKARLPCWLSRGHDRGESEEYIACRWVACKQGIHPGFETHGRCHH